MNFKELQINLTFLKIGKKMSKGQKNHFKLPQNKHKKISYLNNKKFSRKLKITQHELQNQGADNY